MRILHTSDLHLCRKKPETIEALKLILELGTEMSINLLTIAGDLFDSEGDANDMRSELRGLFSGNSFQILAIPGNHDRNAFTGNTYYGDDLKAAIKKPIQVEEYKDITVVAVPYREKLDEELIAGFKSVRKKRKKRILLIHCTLGSGFGHGSFGDEEKVRYFPVSPHTLSALDFDYVLAGHFHSSPYEQLLDNGGVFVYPGSPVSLTTKEVGKRCVLLLDTDTNSRKFVELNSFYRDNLTITVYPGEERERIREIKSWVEKRAGDNCQLTVTVNGFLEKSEKWFNNSLRNVTGPATIEPNYLCIKEILRYPPYRRFKKKLEAREGLDDSGAIDMLVLKVTSRLAERRRLQL